MGDRRTFLGNAAAAAVIAKISPLRSFGFTSDGPQRFIPQCLTVKKPGCVAQSMQYNSFWASIDCLNQPRQHKHLRARRRRGFWATL